MSDAPDPFVTPPAGPTPEPAPAAGAAAGPPGPGGPWRPTPAPPRKTKGGGAWLGVVFAVMLLGSCLVMGLVVLGGAPGAGGPGAVTTTKISGHGKDRVAVIPVGGMISQGQGSSGVFIPGIPSTVARVRDYLERATKDDSVKAVILHINSPGGEVTACDLIHAEIEKFKKETHKPVVAYLEGAAASGGYYIAAPCDQIICYRTTITGSIGVRMSFLNFAELAKKYGVKDYAITSGAHKDMGSMTREPTPEDLQILQGLVDDMYARFLEVVTTGRKLSVDQVKPLADGRILTAKQALAGKLIDGIGSFDDAVAAARSAAGLTEASVVRYQRQPSLFDMLGARSAADLPAARPAGLVAELERLAAPRLMFHLTR